LPVLRHPLRVDRRRAGQRHRDPQPVYVHHRISLFQLGLRGGHGHPSGGGHHHRGSVVLEAASRPGRCVVVNLSRGLPEGVRVLRWRERRLLGMEQRMAVIVSGVVLAAGTLFFLFPIYWLLIGVFKNQGQFFTYPPVFWPTEWGL